MNVNWERDLDENPLGLNFVDYASRREGAAHSEELLIF